MQDKKSSIQTNPRKPGEAKTRQRLIFSCFQWGMADAIFYPSAHKPMSLKYRYFVVFPLSSCMTTEIPPFRYLVMHIFSIAPVDAPSIIHPNFHGKHKGKCPQKNSPLGWRRPFNYAPAKLIFGEVMFFFVPGLCRVCCETRLLCSCSRELQGQNGRKLVFNTATFCLLKPACISNTYTMKSFPHFVQCVLPVIPQ